MEGDRFHSPALQQAVTGAIIATLAAVTARVLGVQQLTRVPHLAFYLPAAAIGAAIGPTRLRPILWIVSVPLVLTVLTVAYTPALRTLARPMIRRDSIEAVDAVAVLGAGLGPDGAMNHETLDRLLSGLTLVRKGVGPVLFVSREGESFGGRMVSDSADQNAIIGLLPAQTPVLYASPVYTTRTEALRMKAIASTRGVSRIAVVTSPLHTRRACATFEAVGFQVVCVPAVLRQSGLDANSDPEDRLNAFRWWLYELFATATYKSNGWIR